MIGDEPGNTDKDPDASEEAVSEGEGGAGTTVSTCSTTRCIGRTFWPMLTHWRKSNQGAPGVDGQSFWGIESTGLEEWLSGIRKDLRAKTYQPQAGAAGDDPEARRRGAAARDSDGDFIMHAPPMALRMPSEFCMSCAPSLGVSVRLFRSV